MFKKGVLSLGFIFWYSIGISIAQGGALKIPEYTVSSPEAASLGKYGNYPVNLSTGVPTISIPLYQVKGKSLELPISLSYHASGIRVDQEATSVGLGWSLMAGGVITRTIRDQVDEQGANGFLVTGSSLPDYNSITNLQGAGTIGTSTALKALFAQDKEPDYFTISANGIAGSFFANNAGSFVTEGMQPFKVDANFSTNTILITDQFGKMYRFGKSLTGAEAIETTTPTTSVTDREPTMDAPLPRQAYTSSWYLTEIISADKTDTIKFTYTQYYYRNEKIISATRYMIYAGVGIPATDAGGKVFDGLRKVGMTTVISNMRMIDKVSFKSGEVRFIYANDRLDVLNTGASIPERGRLTKLEVYDRGGQFMQKIELQNNDYFSRTGNGAAIDGATISADRKKALRLNAVKFYDRTSAVVYDYKLAYDTSVIMAPRNTTSQDYWGYYNGKSNTSIIPQTFFTSSISSQPQFYGESRNADINYMKAGVLNKVIFPTGGFVTYEYEPNYYLSANQLEGQTQANRQISLYAINRHSSCDPGYLSGVPANNSTQFTINDVLGNTGQAVGALTVVFSDYLIYPGQPMTVRLENLTNNQVYYFEHTSAQMSLQQVINTNIDIRQGHTYKLELKTNGATGSNTSICNSPTIEVQINYDYWKPTSQGTIVPMQAGGLRVKQINEYTNTGSVASIKKYEYGEEKYGPGQIGVGSLIGNLTNNFYNYPLLYKHTNSTHTLENVLHFTSDSQTEMGTNSGCPVDYQKVTEYLISTTSGLPEVGKTEYYYERVGADWEPKSSTKFPYTFLVYPSWKEKNLIKVAQYKQTGSSTYELQNVQENAYTLLSEQRVKTLIIEDFQPDIYYAWEAPSITYTDNNPNRFYYYNYYISRGISLKTKEVSRGYVNGVEAMVQNTQYEYNDIFDLKKKTEQDSKGELIQTIYKYTNDVGYTSLVAKNILSSPVQVEIVKSGRVVNGSLLTYNNEGQVTASYEANALATPVNYTSYSTIPSYYWKKVDILYDPTSKIVQTVKSSSGPATVMLWSYGGQYPIASITNTSYATVENILGSTAISNMQQGFPTETEVFNFLAPLWTHPDMAAAQVTGHSYILLKGQSRVKDPRGLYTHFGYDAFGRLALIRDHNLNILKTYCYNYFGQTENCQLQVFVNVQKQGTFTRNNCEPGLVGGSYTYTVPAGTYWSTESQQDADSQAQQNVDANGQAAANTSALCTLPPICLRCSGIDKKCIENVCETGIKVYTSTYYNSETNQTVCIYHYEWSDGSWSADQYEYTPGNQISCLIP
jgi:uncharacterized protein YjhX (UPF0386 family)